MGCGCLLLLVGLAFPRVAIVILLLFSSWFSRAFEGLLIPLLGLVFLPYTLLWYSVVINVYDARWGLWQVLFLVLALGADLSSSFGGVVRHRRRRD